MLQGFPGGARGLAGRMVACVASAALAASVALVVPPGAADASGMELKSIFLKEAIEVTYADDSTESMTFDTFAQKVNGGYDFADCAVKLVKNIDADALASPVGSPDHPFEGTFDGGGNSISDINLSGESYVGLFGYIGPKGSVSNLRITEAQITASSSARVVQHVGAVAGYIHGGASSTGAAIKNCSVDADSKVTVASTMGIDTGKHERYRPTDSPKAGYTDEGVAIEYIGGIAGFCAGGIEGCSFAGSMSITDIQSPDPDRAALVKAVGGVVGQVGGYDEKDAESESSKARFKPSYPTSTGYATPASAADANVSTVSGCRNSGLITSKVDALSKADRFGVETNATINGLAGIAGFSFANVDNCTNTAVLNNETATSSAGIVGNLRSVAFTGQSVALADAGTYKASDSASPLNGPLLTVSDCVNEADIDARAFVGGILGSGGTYTRIEMSRNLAGSLVGERWNKPTVGGIAGNMYGDISHCYNRADTESGTGSGYYIAGIVGIAGRYRMTDSAELDSPIPEIEACYTTGNVVVSGSFRQGGICGENSGYVHDCYYITGHAGGGDAVGLDLGTTTSATVRDMAASDLSDRKTAALLNAPTTLEEYKAGKCFVPDEGSSKVNNGYAVFASQRASETDKTDLGSVADKLSASEGMASYTAASNPVPDVSVAYDGKPKDAFIQGADYYVVPDESAMNGKTCRDVSDLAVNASLRAEIAGIGSYSGETASLKAAYTVGKGDFENCTPVLTAKTYNMLDQTPKHGTSDVKVLDDAGNEVDTASYSMSSEWEGRCIQHRREYVNKEWHTGYPFVFTASETSNYSGSTVGYFQIKKADLTDTERASYEGISYGGQSWNWKMGNISSGGQVDGYLYRTVEGAVVKGMQVVYNGTSIKPTVASVKYKDGNGDSRRLELGKDYRLVYGDTAEVGGLLGVDSSEANTNVTSSTPGHRACLTIRFVPGDDCSFTNYQNIFFEIVQADIAKDCTVCMSQTVNNAQAKPQVSVKGSTGATIPAANYSVSTKALSATQMRVTVAGKGNLKGSVAQTIRIDPTSIVGAKVSLDRENCSYDGKVKSPRVTSVKIGSKVLVPGTDYTLSYSNGRKGIGEYYVVVTGKGSYKGTVSKPFQIGPGAVKMKSAKASGKKKVKVTWKSPTKRVKKNVTGYQVVYSLSKDFSNSKTLNVKGSKKTSAVLKKLKSKKTYFFKVRVYKTVKGKKCAGPWSKQRKAKAK